MLEHNIGTLIAPTGTNVTTVLYHKTDTYASAFQQSLFIISKTFGNKDSERFLDMSSSTLLVAVYAFLAIYLHILMDV